jgi:hypothetical protein
MSYFSGQRAIIWLSKTPVILSALLRDVDQGRAVSARDGDDGWNVLEIVCHLNDLEDIYTRRTRQILENDRPNLIAFRHLDAVIENNYAGQDFRQTLATFIERRKAHVELLKSLTDEQWARIGIHPEFGENPLLYHAINTALHDVNHIEQITRALGLEGAII